jgi:SHS2 domain-containing protein
MDSGFEALPQRSGGRATKRRKGVADGALDEDGAGSASSSSSNPNPSSRTRLDDGRGGGAAGVSSVLEEEAAAADLSAPCLYDTIVARGREQWEYLDHTADVLVHACEWEGRGGEGFFSLASNVAHTPPLLLPPSPSLSAGGDSLAEAFAQVALAFWAHLVDPAVVRFDRGQRQGEEEEASAAGPGADEDDDGGGTSALKTVTITADGKDVLDLLFNFLDACLYAYGSDYFLAGRVRVTRFVAPTLPPVYVDGKGSGAAASATTGGGSGEGGGMMHITAVW